MACDEDTLPSVASLIDQRSRGGVTHQPCTQVNFVVFFSTRLIGARVRARVRAKARIWSRAETRARTRVRAKARVREWNRWVGRPYGECHKHISPITHNRHSSDVQRGVIVPPLGKHPSHELGSLCNGGVS